MSRSIRIAAMALVVALLAACGKSAQDSADAPLAFAPADTPYVYANLEPMPAAITDQWSKKMQLYWPVLFGMYQRMLGDASALDDRTRRIATTLIDEIKTRDTWDKLRELGFKPDMRAAFYGVGLVPVLRIELGDPEKFRAAIARIEQKIGEKVPVAKTGNQDYWQLGNDKLSAMIAIEGHHLVATMAPTNASDALKQTLLGVVRPAQNVVATGTLQALAKQYKYTNYGAGYVDMVHLAERLTALDGSDQEFAKSLLGESIPPVDAVCKSEYLAIARKFPRLVAGNEELSTQRVRVGGQFEMESTLAQQIQAATVSAPGAGAPGEGMVDFTVALPLLKFKDFWIAQADAVAAKPFACGTLAGLNDSFRESKRKVDTTLPPPFSDITGFRIVLDKLDWSDTALVPDFAGKFLIGSTNPTLALTMAQLGVPQLKDVKLTADGKPVALPSGIAPGPVPPLFAAMSDKAIAVAAGNGEEANLTAFLRAPDAATPTFMRIYFSGAFYGMLSRSMMKMKAQLRPEQRDHLQEQTQIFELYEKWMQSGEILLTANPGGIGFEEIVDMKSN